MTLVKIGGLDRQLVLLKSKVDYFIQRFNLYYTKKSLELRGGERALLLEMEQEKDQEKKLKLIDEYVADVERKLESIPFPYKMIYDITWGLLPEEERKRFRNRWGFVSKRAMINSLRVDEIQPLVDTIGMKVLHLSGYNKKKA
jgi:hypothetical protein